MPKINRDPTGVAGRPKVGIALSGASGRAIAHIGVLEVLKENNIPLDIIVGCSSGALIGASYALGTMDFLKDWFRQITFRKMIRYWSSWDAKGGLFHINTNKIHEDLDKILKGQTFEDLIPKLCFVATDLNTGELIKLDEGDLVKAFKATVAVPGLFAPVIYNGRILVDGGLVNIVPTNVAKELGADIVIGVNLAATKFIYEKRLPMWRGYRFVTRFLGLQFFREKVLPLLSPRIFFRFDSQSDTLEETDIKIPGVYSVLSKAMDHALIASEQWKESDMAYDWMIEPRVKHLGKVQFDKVEYIYQEGRRAAKLAVPHIKKLIANYKAEEIFETSKEVKQTLHES